MTIWDAQILTLRHRRGYFAVGLMQQDDSSFQMITTAMIRSMDMKNQDVIEITTDDGKTYTIVSS